MPAPMRDPDWPAMLPHCPGCGYNLTGLLPPVSCPECGFTIDDKTLVLHGVAKTDATQSPLRKTLWIIVIVVGVILLYGWMGLVLLRWFGLAVFVAWLACFIALIATSKRDRSGRSAIVCTGGGFILTDDLSNPRLEGEAVTWDRVYSVRLDRVSGVWYRLRIAGQGSTLLDAGVRCPDEHAKLVYDTIEAYRKGLTSEQAPS